MTNLVHKFGQYLSLGAITAIILAGLLFAAVGCNSTATIMQPPEPPDSTVAVGPPSYAISIPQELLLRVGEKQAWPTVVVFDSTGRVVHSVELGWKFYNLDHVRWTSGTDSVWAVAEGEGTAYPLAIWRQDYNVFYNLNDKGTARITVRALNQ